MLLPPLGPNLNVPSIFTSTVCVPSALYALRPDEANSTLAPDAAVCTVPPVIVPAVTVPKSATIADNSLTFILPAVTAPAAHSVAVLVPAAMSSAVLLFAANSVVVIVLAAICLAVIRSAEIIPPHRNVRPPV